MSVRNKIVFLFSGQGSHYRGMGSLLYKNNKAFAKSFDQSNELIAAYTGVSIKQELYEKKDFKFDDLLITHPAILAIEIAMLNAMEDLGIIPDYVSGNSLGEFAAAVAAGILNEKIALKLVIDQAKSIVQNSLNGGMIAVFEINKQELISLMKNKNLYIASENYSTHFTLSGKKEDIDNLQNELKILNIPFFRLPVAYPFHSPLLKGRQKNNISFELLKKPSKSEFVSGLLCQELTEFPLDYFWKTIKKPTKFSRLVDYLEQDGPCFYIDLGPSGTMANFVKYNLPQKSTSITYSIMNQFKKELNQFNKLQQILLTNTVNIK